MRYADHKEKAESCTKCGLCERRKKIVVARGKLPCDLLFIGEAPGEGEDVIGKPFIGPAGKLLDQIISNSVESNTKIAFTNLVCCMPLDEDMNKREPTKEEIKSCQGRLIEFIEELAKPKVIILVGKLSLKYAPTFESIPSISITHPAAILRANVAQRSLEIQRCIYKIKELFE